MICYSDNFLHASTSQRQFEQHRNFRSYPETKKSNQRVNRGKNSTSTVFISPLPDAMGGNGQEGLPTSFPFDFLYPLTLTLTQETSPAVYAGPEA